MSNADTKVLTDLVKCHTESATTTSIMLKSIFEVLSTMSAKQLVEIRDFMAMLKTERDSFYKTTVKVFIVVFFAQLAIIGMLLKELNVKGADAVKDVGTTGIQQSLPK